MINIINETHYYCIQYIHIHKVQLNFSDAVLVFGIMMSVCSVLYQYFSKNAKKRKNVTTVHVNFALLVPLYVLT